MVVPEELKFGFRDQMGKGEEDGASKDRHQQFKSAPDPKPVENTPAGTSTTPQTAPSSSSPVATQPITASAPISVSRLPPQVPAPTRQVQSEEVPAWIDKAITGLVAALALMVIKKILL
ncbi:hypothetical protein MMC28_004021 [Mycoblastus sanguinarius]|nr:hypothetical protein [Mycoblastus sanguinarius]